MFVLVLVAVVYDLILRLGTTAGDILLGQHTSFPCW